jgi:uncharacterized protein involved in cysteine biosynthesis
VLNIIIEIFILLIISIGLATLGTASWSQWNQYLKDKLEQVKKQK